MKALLQKLKEHISAKAIFYLGLFAVIGIVVYRIYRFFFPSDTTSKTPSAIKSEIDLLMLNPTQKPTYSDSDYLNMADQLFEAMEHTWTDNGAIKEVFSKMYKRMDVLKLIDAYGMRQLHVLVFDDGEKGTLAQHLVSEGATQYANEGLKNHNVYYSF